MDIHQNLIMILEDGRIIGVLNFLFLFSVYFFFCNDNNIFVLRCILLEIVMTKKLKLGETSSDCVTCCIMQINNPLLNVSVSSALYTEDI